MVRPDAQNKSRVCLVSNCIHFKHLSPDSSCLISLPLLDFYTKVTEEEFSLCIFTEQPFRVAVSSLRTSFQQGKAN